ncbi:ester cyclase [Sorangium sp. So ce861]|uniref:ester cyclase n=1 Tax=Sorangium sp. So ce861 TaxID=3133323 RepID=UPI003F5DE6AC
MSQSTEANKQIVRRHLLEAVNQHKPEMWSEIMHPEFTIHHPLCKPGREAYMELLSWYWQAFPDVKVELLHLVAEGDRVVAHYVERGTHLGALFGAEPTGKRYEKHGFAMYRIEGGSSSRPCRPTYTESSALYAW